MESMFCIQHECTPHDWVHPLLSAFWATGCLTCGPYVLPAQKSVTPSEYAAHLKYSLANAYEHVRKCTGAQQQRQKELYDRRVHGQVHDIGELVWLHQSAVPQGSSKKLYHPWTGPYRVLKQLSNVNYRIQDIEQPRMVVHFDWLKSFHFPAMAEEGHQVPSIPLDKDGISSPTPLPGTTLDIIQDELEDTTGGATEQHSPTTSQSHRSPPCSGCSA